MFLYYCYVFSVLVNVLNELLNDFFHSRCGLCTTNGKKRREKLRYSNISFDSY